MTAPTREQVEEWKRAAIAYAASLPQSFRVERDVYSERLAELAFAAGQSGSGTHTDLLRRCRRYVDADAQMMADISRHAPLDPTSQATHDATEYESEKLLPLIDAALTAQHDSGSGAELVREIEHMAQSTCHGSVTRLHEITVARSLVDHPHWPRLRAALLSGDAAREDAERLATAHESVLRSLQKQAPRFEDTDRLDAIETQSWCVGKYESNRFYVHLGQINGKQCEATGVTLREAIDRARGGGDA